MEVHNTSSGRLKVKLYLSCFIFVTLRFQELIPCIWVVTLDKKDRMFVLSDDSLPAIGRITYVPVERDSHPFPYSSIQGKSWHCNFGWSLLQIAWLVT